jgi:hypothetical protein
MPKVLIGCGVVVLVLAVGGWLAASYLFNRVTKSALGSADCELISTADVNTLTSGTFELVQLGGITSAAGVAVDGRVIPDGTTCMGSEKDKDAPRLIRIARLTTPDAAARYQRELTQATGVTQNRGNGVSVSSEPYYAHDVQDGDQAFCTTTDPIGFSGILVRRGDALIYVSVSSGVGGVPNFAPGPNGSIVSADDEAHCTLAQKVADKVS